MKTLKTIAQKTDQTKKQLQAEINKLKNVEENLPNSTQKERLRIKQNLRGWRI